MPQHFTVKFVWLLSSIVAAGGSPAFAAQAANSEVRACQHQAGKIVSSKGLLRLTVSPDGVITGSGGKTALAE